MDSGERIEHHNLPDHNNNIAHQNIVCYIIHDLHVGVNTYCSKLHKMLYIRNLNPILSHQKERPRKQKI